MLLLGAYGLNPDGLVVRGGAGMSKRRSRDLWSPSRLATRGHGSVVLPRFRHDAAASGRPLPVAAIPVCLGIYCLVRTSPAVGSYAGGLRFDCLVVSHGICPRRGFNGGASALGSNTVEAQGQMAGHNHVCRRQPGRYLVAMMATGVHTIAILRSQGWSLVAIVLASRFRKAWFNRLGRAAALVATGLVSLVM
jgi:hypothetical protein